MYFNTDKKMMKSVHMISSKALEIQRTNNSYVEFNLEDLFIRKNGLTGNACPGWIGENAYNHGSDDLGTYNSDDIFAIALKSHGMPKHTIEKLELRRGNEVLKYAGSPELDDIDIKVTDFVGANVEKLIQTWEFLTYNPVTGILNPSWKYKTDGKLVEYTADGSVERSWELKGCWISDVEYGDYDRSSKGEEREISLTLHVDKAYPSWMDPKNSDVK